MRALVVDPNAPGYLRLGEAPDPVVGREQVLIQVDAVSLNRGELPEHSGAALGSVPGWDAAGTVVRAAANGKGPAVGERVTTFGGNGAWAELRAANIDTLAVVPAGVDLGAASTLPVAGLTALHALRAAGAVVGRRVLITGASGGVGRFAVQLAHQAGAHVIAVVGSAGRGVGLAELGADEVVVGIDAVALPVYAVLENVGGPALVTGFGLLEEGGSLLSIGGASGEPSVFPPYGTVGPLRSLLSFHLTGALGPDLAYLVSLLQAGRLDPQIDWRGSWDRAAEAVAQLLARKVAGKAVLEIR